MKKQLYWAFIIFLYQTVCFGQDSLLVRQDTFPSAITTSIVGDRIQFTPIIRPLMPIPGGRQAFYTYLWDFGDGSFSTAEKPEHQYQQVGEYDVSLYVVNNYDNGPRPKKPKTKVKVESKLASIVPIPNSFEDHFFKSNGIFQIFKNADAVPGEDMSLVIGVKPLTKKGKIILLTNEKLINPNGFIVANQSQYYQERLIPVVNPKELQTLWAHVNGVSITQSGSPDYGNREELSFKDREAISFFTNLIDGYKTVSQYEIEGELASSQFSIVNLDISPDMLADTNAIVTVTGIYLAEGEGENPVIHKLDIPIIKSHDPNKMSLRPALLDYRLQFKKKKLTYKVQFQNDGEGDAKDIRLEMFFPEQVDVQSFKLLNLYPQCDSCLTETDLGCYTYEFKGEHQINFHFKGIALPGTASPTLTDQDSSKGFIRFTLQSHKKLQNKSLASYTDIFFDKNDPIRTNKSVARFRPGLSPFVSIGLHTPTKPEDDELGKLTKGLTIGLGIAPIAPYRKPYWQIELFASTFGNNMSQSFANRRGEIQAPDEKGNLVYQTYNAVDSTAKKAYVSLQIPVQIRYNFTRYLSAGVGALVKTNLNYKNQQQLTYQLMNADGTQRPYTVDVKTAKEPRSALLLSPLVDLNIGRAYLGPALGLRYHFDKIYKNNLNLYLMWRL